MAGIKGDFTGFSFGGEHSSTLGITRVADGDFYNEALSPTFGDKTATVNGADFTYYFGTNYTQREFSINIAFDSLSESELRHLKQIFSSKQLKPIIFDEVPYKKYMVKCTNAPQLQYVCFDSDPSGINSQRIYKGSGTLNFTAYYPYGIGLYHTLNDVPSSITNISEWSNSGVLPTSVTTPTTGRVYIKNTGDLPMEYNAYLAASVIPNVKQISYKFGTTTNAVLNLDTSKKALITGDTYIRINSRAHLIEGCDSSKNPTGNLYNQWITSGDFFKIPIDSQEGTFTVQGTSGSYIAINELQYNYVYF